ncbi:MAG TPA: O-antigen ligase family protein [Ktedonobacterales bacterium]|jgi:hypothetical protein
MGKGEIVATKKRPTDIFKNLRLFFLVVVGAALFLEAEGGTSDPWAVWARLFHDPFSAWHSDLSAWGADQSSTTVGGSLWFFDWKDIRLIVSPLELLLLILVIAIFVRARLAGQPVKLRLGSLRLPLLVFAGCVAFGVVNGLTHGAQFNIALWEVRGFLMMVLVFFLASILIREEEHVNQLIWTVMIAVTGLALENSLRWLFIVRNLNVADDLAYDHIDAVILGFAVVLCLSLLLIGGTRSQRAYAIFLLPLLIFVIEVMRRRAAFAVLFVGLAVLFLLLFRLRPQLTWKILVPAVLFTGMYLAVFWNNTSPIGQPARAIRSQITPDERDQQSDEYRVREKFDIIANIQASPFVGLGFGAPYEQNYMLLYKSSVGALWPFFAYTTHNNILWVWMKDGAIGFIAFWWLLGSGVFEGSRAIETQREHWELVSALRTLLQSNRRGRRQRRRSREILRSKAARSAALAYAQGRSARERTKRSARGAGENRYRGPAWNVPTWERSDGLRTRTARRSGAVAGLIAAICLIPMQVSFSYVDLGLNSERDLLLFGLALAIISHAQSILGLDKETAPMKAVRPRGASRGTRTPAPNRAASEAWTVGDTPSDVGVDELEREAPVGGITVTAERPVSPGPPGG